MNGEFEYQLARGWTVVVRTSPQDIYPSDWQEQLQRRLDNDGWNLDTWNPGSTAWGSGRPDWIRFRNEYLNLYLSQLRNGVFA